MDSTNNNFDKTSFNSVEIKLEDRLNLLDQNQLKEILDDIMNSTNDLKTKYDELNKIASPIQYDKLLGMIKYVDTEKSMNALLTEIKGLAECTLDTFQLNNKNLENILRLIMVIGTIEKDLYKRLQDGTSSKEEISRNLNELTRKYSHQMPQIKSVLNIALENSSSRVAIEQNIAKLQNRLYWTLGFSIVATISAVVGFVI